jgi:NMD protein affecting ribosome stability and mRNA decay
MRCLVCGKEAYKEGLCEEHYYELKFKKKKELKKIREKSLKVCPICGKVNFHGKIYRDEPSFRRKIEKWLEDLGLIEHYQGYEIDEDELKLKFSVGSIEHEEKIKAKFEVCKDCSKVKANFYNVVIQLRSKREGDEITLEKIIKNNAIGYYSQRSKDGIDFYVYYKKTNIYRLVGLLKKHWKVKVSSKLVTVDKQTSKQKKRFTISLREK